MNPDIYVVIEHLRGQVKDISYIMLAAARVLARGTGGHVVAVLLGHNTQELADDLVANSRLYIEHPALAEFTPEAYQQVLAQLIRSNTPRVVLFGDTSIGAELAGVLSARLRLPLVSHCRTVHAENGSITFTCQICGGKILAEGLLPDSTALITMMPGGFKPEEGKSSQQIPLDEPACPEITNLRVTFNRYIEPEISDVDITQQSILVAVGRGIEREDNIALAEELAEALGGVVCASRPVVDQGWLPISRMVGKSGKAVRPTVYLALGISGAPEHVEGMSNSETIIAINVDPHAPIFDAAKYGAEFDLLDLLPVLTEQIRLAKGG
jgi:electron transfer flavoprotein alpha subunit